MERSTSVTKCPMPKTDFLNVTYNFNRSLPIEIKTILLCIQI